MIRRSIEIAADPEPLFALTQDYARRLDWDSFLREARLLDGAAGPAVGVRTWCVARSGLGMETEYVSFRPPHACAVAMTRGPWCCREFAGSWRFDPIAPGRTRVSFAYHLCGRPALLTGLLRMAFDRDTRRRLLALKRHVEALAGPGARPARSAANGRWRASKWLPFWRQIEPETRLPFWPIDFKVNS